MGRGMSFQIQVLKGNHNMVHKVKPVKRKRRQFQTYGAALAQIKALCGSEVLMKYTEY